MSRILFVDDDPDVLGVLRDLVAALDEGWEASFATSGQEALGLLDGAHYDVVVTDMVMPSMDGAQLLDEVRHRRPSVVRIVLSGQAEDRTRPRSVDSAHQYLRKPFDLAVFRDTLRRARALRDLMAEPRLKQVVARMGALPSLPSLYLQLREACRDPDVSLRTVAEIIGQDAAMTAKVLQMVNSAFFGLRRRVSSPLHAIQLLGLDTVRALVLSAHVFFGCDPLRLQLCSMEHQWSHSLLVSTLAAAVARLEDGTDEVVDDARVAGLLHAAGALVLAASLPGAYSEAVHRAKLDRMPLVDAEAQAFGVSHAAIGGYLLALWALPEPVVEAVAFHHAPRECLARGFSALTAVHVAEALAHELHPEHVVGAASELDLDYLEELGLAGRLPAWCEAGRGAAAETAAARD
jgi:HD-like signal output (HDOD) protein